MKWFDLHTHKMVEVSSNEVSIFNLSTSDQTAHESWCSVGLHPWYLTTRDEVGIQISQLYKAAIMENVIAVGECGLDKICKVDFSLQKAVFESHVGLSEEVEKPLIIHCVKAIDELLEIKKRIMPSQSWIIHGFRGNSIQAEQLISNGFSLSFGEKFNEKTIKSVPLSSVFIETDESSLSIELIYQKVAQIKEMNVDELKVKMWENAKSLFPIIDRK